MSEFFNLLLSSEGYIPHGHCYLWKPELIWLHIVSNSAIALAYFSIPILLIYFVSRRKDIPFNWVFLLFGAFIVACGSGHLIDIWTIWHPNYWLSGILKAITAIVSLYTALEMIPLLPKLLALPSPAQLETTNRELEQTLHRLQQTQAQLIQTEKMAGLGQLVAGVAHELNNPISFIHGNLIYAKQYTEAILQMLSLYQQAYPIPTLSIQAIWEEHEIKFIQEDLPRAIESMQMGADRIRQIVVSLRNFSRLDEAERKSVNIHDGIDSTLLILQHRLKGAGASLTIQVRQEYGELPLVECYAGQMNQVFMNLLSNAIDALNDRRHLQPTPDNLQPELPVITIRTQADQDSVSIQISDNGSGMSPQIQAKIFNPFFTTKGVGQGTGLGLSISYQIVVEKHGGHLDCISSFGKGTTFWIKIPRSKRILPSSPHPLIPSSPHPLIPSSPHL
ncbi:MAG: HAMP domain-containing histidine kinase [Cyanobacteria bacterium CRU_2_1]|nr:HAMP domain-containing histidine kinase [Cyanobacteria bacterium RU_5_0]NJR61490.1 HAMP domain-containing histidine kinase [Cyanobacteria bacterium CRU_2_1]